MTTEEARAQRGHVLTAKEVRIRANQIASWILDTSPYVKNAMDGALADDLTDADKARVTKQIADIADSLVRKARNMNNTL